MQGTSTICFGVLEYVQATGAFLGLSYFFRYSQNTIVLFFMKTQVLRYNTGSAIRPKNSRQDQFWDIIHGQEGDGEAQEALTRNKGVQLCGTQPPKKRALSDLC